MNCWWRKKGHKISIAKEKENSSSVIHYETPRHGDSVHNRCQYWTRVQYPSILDTPTTNVVRLGREADSADGQQRSTNEMKNNTGTANQSEGRTEGWGWGKSARPHSPRTHPAHRPLSALRTSEPPLRTALRACAGPRLQSATGSQAVRECADWRADGLAELLRVTPRWCC